MPSSIAQDPGFAAKLPRWRRDALPDVRSFILLPLTAHRKPVGVIYGDWGVTQNVVRPAPDKALPLNELRMLLTVAASMTTESRRIPGLRDRRQWHPVCLCTGSTGPAKIGRHYRRQSCVLL